MLFFASTDSITGTKYPKLSSTGVSQFATVSDIFIKVLILCVFTYLHMCKWNHFMPVMLIRSSVRMFVPFNHRTALNQIYRGGFHESGNWWGAKIGFRGKLTFYSLKCCFFKKLKAATTTAHDTHIHIRISSCTTPTGVRAKTSIPR